MINSDDKWKGRRKTITDPIHFNYKICILFAILFINQGALKTISYALIPCACSSCDSYMNWKRPLSMSPPLITSYRKRVLAAFAKADDTAPLQPATSDDDVTYADTEYQSINVHNTVKSSATIIDADHEEYLFLKQVSTLSSSPERLCVASAMAQCCTIEEIYALRENYNIAAHQLHGYMSNRSPSGHEKHQEHCKHRYRFGRQPFVCNRCWSYLPICICHKQVRNNSSGTTIQYDDVSDAYSIFQRIPRLSLPSQNELHRRLKVAETLTSVDTVDMIMWTHHKEWGSTSNTGSVLVVALEQIYQHQHHRYGSINLPMVVGRMLMKGYDEHDNELQQIISSTNNDEIVIPVVLWAAADQGNDPVTTDDCVVMEESKRQFVSVDQLLEELTITSQRSSKTILQNVVLDAGTEMTKAKVRLVIIAVEGTWNQAKRMVTKLPIHVRALHLSDMELFGWRMLEYNNTDAMSNDEISSQEKMGDDVNANKSFLDGAVSILDPLRKQKTINRFPSKKKKSTMDDDNVPIDTNTTSCNDELHPSKVINTNKVCTVEAAVSALVGLNILSIPEGHYVLNLADQKVMRTVTYQGKMTLRNIIAHW